MIRNARTICIALLLSACGSSDDESSAASGGAAGTVATGGNSGDAGSVATGGNSGEAGSTAAGGSAGTTGPLPDPVGCTPGAPVGSGPYAYFETLRARPECHVALSLRDAKQVGPDLEGGYSGHGGPPDVTYDPANDPYPFKQDAAKIVVPADKNSLPNQLRLPIKILHGERAVITWDAWFGPEFQYSNHLISNYKTWQFCSYGDSIWDEIGSRWSAGPKLGTGALAAVHGRTYSQIVGPSVTANQPLAPQIGDFTLFEKRWVRYWALFEPAGDYDAYSLWVADEVTDPVQVFDGLELQFRSSKDGTATPQMGVFRVEFNTSTNEVQPNRSALVAYARNYVVLKGDVDVASILAKPQSN